MTAPQNPSVEFVASCRPLLIGVEAFDLPLQPTGPYVEQEWDDWRQQWHDALGLNRIGGGLNVAVREIQDSQLLVSIIDFALGDTDEDDDSILALDDSGLTLLIDGHVVAEPACCMRIDECLATWRSFIETQPATWEIVWVGHPWVMGMVVDGAAQFTEQSETPELTSVAQAPIAALTDALPPALQDLEDFADRLASRLVTRGISNRVETARTIAGLG